MSVQFPPGSFTPEKPYTDPAGVAWVVWSDSPVDGEWHARPVKANAYNIAPFSAANAAGFFTAGTSKDVLASINARASTRMAALANDRNTASSPRGGGVILLVVALLAMFAKKGR